MNLSLTLAPRTAPAADLRLQGRIPGVMYGRGVTPTSFSVAQPEFEKLYRDAGESTLIDVMVEGAKEPVKALIKDVQMDPVKRVITHIDLHQLRMDEEMNGVTELRFIGVAPAEKELSGTLAKSLEYLNIRCLPKFLISHIDVDISVLKTFEDAIHVGDVVMPEGVVCTDTPDILIAKVVAPMTEEQLKALDEAAPVKIEDVEVEKKGKKEEEGAEGEGKKDEKKK